MRTKIFSLKRLILILTVLFCLLLLLGPFVVPIPALEGTRPARQIAAEEGRFIQAGGFEVYFHTLGESVSGLAPILLLPGMGCSHHTWDAVLPLLSAERQVIAIDLPGYGLTRPIQADDSPAYTLEGRAEFIITFMDALNLQQVVLVGNSAGAKLAAYTALQFPERVSQLVLVDAALQSGTPSAAVPLLNTPQMNRLGPLFARAFIKQWHPLLYNSRHDPDSVDDAVRKVYEEPLQVQNWDEELWMLIKNASGTLTPQQLGELSQPVLVVHGQSDTLVSLEESQNLYEIIPGAEWLLIPNSGHLPQEETPQALSTGILSFLEKKK